MTDQPERPGLRWGFSTLGCPGLTLPDVCRLAAEFKLGAIELRALHNRTDFPKYVAEEKLLPGRVRDLLKPFHGQIVVAGSDFKLIGNSESNRVDFLAYCKWAEFWEIPYVRVFGGGMFGQPLAAAEQAEAVKSVHWWQKENQQRNWRTEILLETHDAFSNSAPCVQLCERLDQPLGIIWDSHHTWRLAGESPAESWSQLGPWVRHVHFKDSVDLPSTRHPFTYVLPGTGQVPLREIMNLLRQKQFAGVVSLEWEKMWHAYLPDLREALVCLQTQDWFANRQAAAVSFAANTRAVTTSGAASPSA
jgi:sugar phosphate isomerase/epimerase